MGGPRARHGTTTTVGGPSSLRSDFPSSVNHLQNPSDGEIALDYRRSSEIPWFGPERSALKRYSAGNNPADSDYRAMAIVRHQPAPRQDDDGMEGSTRNTMGRVLRVVFKETAS